MAFRVGPPPALHPTFKKPKGSAASSQGELFDELLPAAWRGIVFPVQTMRFSLTQDLVEHKYWGVAAARVENTGRAPLVIEATIPLVNGIVPGKAEKWGGEGSSGGGGTLYPDVFLQLLEAFQDGTSGVLNHPQHSGIVVKGASFEYTLDGELRDGVIATARWVETIDPDLAVEDPFKTKSPITSAKIAAANLDASKDDLLALVPDAAFDDFSVTDLLDKATGFVDNVNSSTNLLLAKPGQLMSHVTKLQDSLERSNSVMTWAAIQQCEQLKESARAMQKQETKTVYRGGRTIAVPIVNPGKKVRRYRTKTSISITGLEALFAKLGTPNSVAELLELNPALNAYPEVAEGVTIRYYVRVS